MKYFVQNNSYLKDVKLICEINCLYISMLQVDIGKKSLSPVSTSQNNCHV